MNQVLKTITFALAALIGLSKAFPQTDTLQPTVPLTFEEAYLQSLQKNFGLKESDAIVQMKKQEMMARRGLYMPKVSLSASYVFMSEDIVLDLNPLKESITPLYSTLGHYGNFSGVPNPDPATNQMVPILPDDVSTQAVRGQLLSGLEEIESSDWTETVQKKQFGVVTANMAYPLYAGGKIRYANKAAQVNYNESQTDLRIAESKLSVELAERYYGLALAHEALQVRQGVFETMKKHLHEAELLMQQGMIANAEYLHTKVYYSEAERELKKAQRQIEQVNEGLLNTLSDESGATILPVSKLFFVDTLPPLAYYLTTSDETCEYLEKIDCKKQLADINYQVERREYLPQVAAFGTYDIINKDLSPLVPEYMVGIQMSWNIFEGASRLKKHQAAIIQKERVDYLYQKTSSDIHAAITREYKQLQICNELMGDLKTAREFASEYYRVQQKAFSEGMATASEVADANLALAKVKIDELKAMYDFDVALARLLQYAGLSEQFLVYQQ